MASARVPLAVAHGDLPAFDLKDDHAACGPDDEHVDFGIGALGGDALTADDRHLGRQLRPQPLQHRLLGDRLLMRFAEHLRFGALISLNVGHAALRVQL